MIYTVKWKLFTLYLTLFCIISAVYSITSEPVCSICKCREKLVNCSDLEISELPQFDGHINVTTVLLDRNALLTLHQFPALTVYHLSVANNDIMNIADSAFKNLANLTILDFSNNLLTSNALMPHVFRGNYAPDSYEPLRHLKRLNLANNLLRILHPNIFEHVPYLEVLNLSGNPLTIINLGTSVALSSIPSLKELYLAQTSLETIPNFLFHGLKHLEVLNLAYNLFVQIPKEIQNSRIKWLSLDGNPIKYIDDPLNLTYLRTLRINRMPKLKEIKSRTLSNLPVLEEFYCSDNIELEKIANDAFSAINIAQEGETWPILKVLVLKNNSLRYIESHLVSRWDHLTTIDLQDNPWVCDCENQWLVSTLTPMIKAIQPQMLNSFKCFTPTEMKDTLFVDLYHRNYHLRCLDLYNNKPEKDGKLLLNVCFVALICTPFIMAAILYYKRKRRASAYYRKPPFFRDSSQPEFFSSQPEVFSYVQLKSYTK